MPLKTFATSRPVLYGAPVAAAFGVVLGLVFQVGSQSAPSVPVQGPSRAYAEDSAHPIAWPSGKVPDYVIGTDFLAQANSRAYPPAIYAQDDYVVEPTPIAARPAQATQPIAITARPAREESRWASTQGDILDVRLPEDTPVETPFLN